MLDLEAHRAHAGPLRGKWLIGWASRQIQPPLLTRSLECPADKQRTS
jgi:hypothetical protein